MDMQERNEKNKQSEMRMQKRVKEHDRQDRNIKVETKKLRVGSWTKQTEKGKPGKEKGRRERRKPERNNERDREQREEVRVTQFKW